MRVKWNIHSFEATAPSRINTLTGEIIHPGRCIVTEYETDDDLPPTTLDLENSEPDERTT